MPRLNRDRTAEGNKRPAKLNNSENGTFDLERLKRTQKGWKSLRINVRTVILVPPEKYNEEYRLRYESQMNKD